MQALSAIEIDQVHGALTTAEWLGIGMGMVGLGLGIAAAPVGALGVGVATGLSYFGGVTIGTAAYQEFAK